MTNYEVLEIALLLRQWLFLFSIKIELYPKGKSVRKHQI